MTQSPDTSKILDADGKRRIQEVVGVLLYHTRALNSPALASLSDIGTEQAQPTANTAAATTKLLKYCATYPNPTLRFIASDTILRDLVTHLIYSSPKVVFVPLTIFICLVPCPLIPLKVPLNTPLLQN